MTCKYCDDSYTHFHYVNEDDTEGNNVEMTITNGSGGQFYLELYTGSYYTQVVKPINYCPMCGDELNKREEANE